MRHLLTEPGKEMIMRRRVGSVVVAMALAGSGCSTTPTPAGTEDAVESSRERSDQTTPAAAAEVPDTWPFDLDEVPEHTAGLDTPIAEELEELAGAPEDVETLPPVEASTEVGQEPEDTPDPEPVEPVESVEAACPYLTPEEFGRGLGPSVATFAPIVLEPGVACGYLAGDDTLRAAIAVLTVEPAGGRWADILDAGDDLEVLGQPARWFATEPDPQSWTLVVDDGRHEVIVQLTIRSQPRSDDELRSVATELAGHVMPRVDTLDASSTLHPVRAEQPLPVRTEVEQQADVVLALAHNRNFQTWWFHPDGWPEAAGIHYTEFHCQPYAAVTMQEYGRSGITRFRARMEALSGTVERYDSWRTGWVPPIWQTAWYYSDSFPDDHRNFWTSLRFPPGSMNLSLTRVRAVRIVAVGERASWWRPNAKRKAWVGQCGEPRPGGFGA